jgi:hypothetical protein
MFRAEHHVMVDASERLLERSEIQLERITHFADSAEQILKGAADGPAGIALLAAEELASLVSLLRAMSANAANVRSSLTVILELMETESPRLSATPRPPDGP